MDIKKLLHEFTMNSYVKDDSANGIRILLGRTDARESTYVIYLSYT